MRHWILLMYGLKRLLATDEKRLPEISGSLVFYYCSLHFSIVSERAVKKTVAQRQSSY